LLQKLHGIFGLLPAHDDEAVLATETVDIDRDEEAVEADEEEDDEFAEFDEFDNCDDIDITCAFIS
jgi:hypothetical protein